MRLIVTAFIASAVAYLVPSRTITKRIGSRLVAISSGMQDDPSILRDEESSGEDMDEMERTLRDNAPSDLEVRLNILGITPWTVTGFVLAGFIIILNNILGNGWASELLGIDSNVPSAYVRR